MFTIYATDYAPVDPITPPCDIVPIFIGYRGENKARCLVFDLTECVNTFGDGGFVISFIRQGDDLPYLVTDTDRLDNNAIWIITDTDTAVDGYGMVQLQYIVDDVVCKSALYRTVTFDSNGIPGDVPDPYEDLLAQIAAYAAQAEGAATTATAAAQIATTAVEEGIKTERSQRIAADEGLNTRINELMGLAGAPSMANSAAAMTDSSKIYVYTGNEAGYLTGHWYYYNGTEWADGGVYQATAVDTDKTLTVENMAADAAVVGEKIDECMAAFVINSASGSIASFTDGADGVPLKDLVVNITPNQANGTPSPDNVLPITGWTEANIYSRGGNLWDEDWVLGYYRVADGALISNTSGYIASKNKVAVRPSTTYYFNTHAIRFEVFEYGADEAFLRRSYINANNSNIVTGDDAYFITFSSYTNNYGATYNYDLSLNYPSTDTAYHASNLDSTVYNVSFGSSAGTVYGGTLDVTTGMLTVTYGSLVATSALYSGTSGSASYWCQVLASGAKKIPNSTIGNTKASYLPTTSQTTMINTEVNAIATNNNGAVTFKIVGMTSKADYDTYLAAHPLTIVYELQNPISVQLDPVSVASLLGNNNIWSDTGSVASCAYRADTKLYLEKLTNPDDDMVANANITSGQYFMVNNNLYLATSAISSGATIVPGTNCTETNLAAALNAINA